MGIQLVRNRKLLDWAPRGEPSNCPMLASQMKRFAKFTPWQLHSVVRKVFAGRIPSLQAGAMARDMFGQPPFTVAISDGMYSAADQCIYLWESSMRLLSEGQVDLERGLSVGDVLIKINETTSGRGLEDKVKKVVSHLRRALRDGDPTALLRLSVADVELPLVGVPEGDLRHRPRRQFLWEQFVLSHELAHIILGHLGPTGSLTASRYADDAVLDYWNLPTWSTMTDDIQRDEATADLFGLLELSYASSWEISQREGVNKAWRDRSQLALLVQHLDGAAIATLIFYLLSALGVSMQHASTHPHPDDRLALIFEAVLVRMKAIISTTSEPDEGYSSLPGFYERALSSTRSIPAIYRILTNAFELALER